LALSSCVALAAFALYAGWVWFMPNAVSEWRAQPVIWLVVGASCAIQVLGSFAMGYLRGMQRFDRAASITIISVLIQLAGVAAGSLTFGVIGALCGTCIGGILPAAFALSLSHREKLISVEVKRRVMRYARYAWAAGLASAFVWSRAEVFFLDHSWGKEAVGMFTVALTFSNLAVQGPVLLTGGLLPYFSESYGRNALEEIREGYGTATRLMGFLAFPACFGLAAIMPAALPLVYGQAFSDAVPAAIILVTASSFAAVSSVGASLVFGADRSDFVFVSGCIGAALSIFAGLTVIPLFGVLGASWSRAGIQTGLVAFGLWFILQRLRCRTPLRDLARLLIAAALCALSARASILLIPGLVAIPIAVLAGISVYVVAVRILTPLPSKDVDRLRSICRKLPGVLRISSVFGLHLIFGG
jgi:O-antigen/teichoic acid export membrane protein